MGWETVSHVGSFFMAVLAFAGVMYNMGRYSSKIERLERHEREILDWLNVELPKNYARKDLVEQDTAYVKEKLSEISGSINVLNSSVNKLMIENGKIQGHLQLVEANRHNP